MNPRAALAALAALLVLQVLGAGAAAGDPTVAATRRCLNMCLPNQKACGSECVLRTTPCEEEPTTACNAPPSPAYCNAVPARGKCDGSVTRWYHHLAEDRCKKFEWGGCEDGSNDNRFESEEACARRCPTGNEVEKESPDTDVEVGAGRTGMQEPVEEVTAADLSGAAAGTPASDDDDSDSSGSSSSSSSSGEEEAPAGAAAKPQAESQRPKPVPVPAGDGDHAVGYGEHVRDVAGYALDQHAQPPKPSADELRAAAERQKLAAEQQRRAEEQTKQESLEREKANKAAKKEAEVEPTTGPVKLAQETSAAQQRVSEAEAAAKAKAEAEAAAAEKKRQEELARKQFVAVPVVPPPAQKGNAPAAAPPVPQKATPAQVQQAKSVSESAAQIKQDMQDALLRERESVAAAQAEKVKEAAAKAAAADKAENERLARLKAERKQASEERRKTKEESLKSQCRCERKRAQCQSACAPAAPCPCATQRCNCPVTRQHHEKHEAAKKEAPLQCNGKSAGPKVTALLDDAPGAAAGGKATHRDRACAAGQQQQPVSAPAAGKTTCFGRLLCPFDNAVCCDDQATCCPATYRCVASDTGATKCVPPGATA